MAVITYGEASSDYASPTDFLDLASMQGIVATPTLAVLVDKNGFGLRVTGIDLDYSVAGITGGLATAFEVFAAGGGIIYSITGLSTPAAPLATDLSAGQLALSLLSGNDRVNGSSHGDIMAAGGGNDRLFGGGGRDIIAGMNGVDRMAGGAGADYFVFKANNGTDIILDFTDTGGRSDDVIALRRGAFDSMVMEDDGNDVLLHFGTSGTLRILNQTAAEMGADDFTFSLPL